MTRSWRATLCRALLGLAVSCSVAGCRDDVVLGTWARSAGGSAGGSAGTAGSGGRSGDAGSAGEVGEPMMPSCLESAAPGPLNLPGQEPGATETATDWSWPAPVSSMQWDLMVEREYVRPPPGTPPGGYYYAYQFSFLEGVVGFIGIQADGVYQEDPPLSSIDITKMAVFWLSGPPLDAELGDIEFPDARVASHTSSGVNYSTIHARFDWQVCHVYRFSIGPGDTEADGSIWYEAQIEDLTDDELTVLGRMLLPADTGPLSPFSVSRSLPIEYGSPDACSEGVEASVVYEVPTTRGGNVTARLAGNRFDEPPKCASSRFSLFGGAVRHELGLPP